MGGGAIQRRSIVKMRAIERRFSSAQGGLEHLLCCMVETIAPSRLIPLLQLSNLERACIANINVLCGCKEAKSVCGPSLVRDFRASRVVHGGHANQLCTRGWVIVRIVVRYMLNALLGDIVKENVILDATRQSCVDKVYAWETLAHVVTYMKFIQDVFVPNQGWATMGQFEMNELCFAIRFYEWEPYAWCEKTRVCGQSLWGDFNACCDIHRGHANRLLYPEMSNNGAINWGVCSILCWKILWRRTLCERQSSMGILHRISYTNNVNRLCT